MTTISTAPSKNRRTAVLICGVLVVLAPLSVLRVRAWRMEARMMSTLSNGYPEKWNRKRVREFEASLRPGDIKGILRP